MATDLIEVDQENPSEEVLEKVVSCIRNGKLVAVPTDALYAIVADPMNLHAVTRVYAAKGREATRALPLVVTDRLMAEDLAGEITERFRFLARRYWPGPLTLIVPASAKVPLKVTGNTGRLAMRQSKSKLLNALLEKFDRPLICTSANISGQATCRSGIEVFGTMDTRVDLVVDGGLCLGSGATTIDITEPWWRVIKQGSISEQELADVLRGH